MNTILELRHLNDENNEKERPNDKRCMPEARVKGLQPFAVTHNAGSLDQAVIGAATKMKKFLETTVTKDQRSLKDRIIKITLGSCLFVKELELIVNTRIPLSVFK